MNELQSPRLNVQFISSTCIRDQIQVCNLIDCQSLGAEPHGCFDTTLCTLDRHYIGTIVPIECLDDVYKHLGLVGPSTPYAFKLYMDLWSRDSLHVFSFLASITGLKLWALGFPHPDKNRYIKVWSMYNLFVASVRCATYTIVCIVQFKVSKCSVNLSPQQMMWGITSCHCRGHVPNFLSQFRMWFFPKDR